MPSPQNVSAVARPMWVAITWFMALLMIGLFLSPPALFVRDMLGISLDAAGMSARGLLFIHAVALTFMAILVYVILALVPGEWPSRCLIMAGTGCGYIVGSVAALVYAYGGRHPVAHGLMLLGLSLSFFGAAGLWYDLLPWRRERGWRDAVGGVLWLTTTLMMVTILIGAIFGSVRDPAMLASDIWIRTGIAHLHTTLAIIPMALVALLALRYGSDRFTGRPRFLCDAALWLAGIGAAIAVLANYAYIWVGGIAHKVITPASAVTLMATLVVLGVIIHQLHGIERARGTGSALRRVLVGDGVRAGQMLVLLWVNVVVALPGIYVAFNLERFREPDMERVKHAFEFGHYHILALLSGVVLLLLVVDLFGLTGRLRQAVGWGITAGYVVATTSAVPYMFLDPDPHGHFILPVLDAGLGLVTLGLLAAYVVITRQVLGSPARTDITAGGTAG